jgi:hypothetical protein
MLDNKVFEAMVREMIAQGLEQSSPVKRGRLTNELMRLVHEHRFLLAGARIQSPCFDDAWAITIEHFFQNLWHPKTKGTKSAYCEAPDVILRLKSYLGHRIDDTEMALRGYRKPSDNPGDDKQWSMKPLSLDANTDGKFSLGDILAAPDDEYQWLSELIKSDVTGQLQGTIMKSYPHVNCQNSQLLFLDGHSWREIAVRFRVPEQALYTFLRRNCWPLMKNLCE